MFTLPETAGADLVGYIGDVMTDGWVFTVGIPLAFYVIRKLIALVPKGR